MGSGGDATLQVTAGTVTITTGNMTLGDTGTTGTLTIGNWSRQ